MAVSFAKNSRLTGDARFESLSQIVDGLRTLKPKLAPSGLRGNLRSYQNDGLGWLSLLAEHKLGGILADDMGLGKTVQVLALLESFRSMKRDKKPHLLVAPKSLIFNWQSELAKFTPELKALDFTSTKRHKIWDQIDRHDIVLTTYQTLRSDIEKLSKVKFDAFILDEAQYIKNAKSQASLACDSSRPTKSLRSRYTDRKLDQRCVLHFRGR